MKKREKSNLSEPVKAIIDATELRRIFHKSSDVQFQEYTFKQHKVMFITCDAMIDRHLLNAVVIERVQLFFDALKKISFEEAVEGYLHIPEKKKIEGKSDIVSSVYSGKVLLYFEDYDVIYSSNIANIPNRTPEESNIEVPVKGARDNFIEDLSINIALIRKRLPTDSLCVEKLELGKRTKTTVAILYFDDIANKATLNEIKDRMNQVNVDIIFSGDILMEQIDNGSKIFPQHDYTGRPDYAVQSLARGRFLILVDGVTYGIITPVTLFVLLKTAEDNEYPTIFSSFARLLRLSSLLLGLLLPAAWLALTTYHQNQLPLLLLATVVQSRIGLPLPSVIEMLLMILLFELFREAGLRLPSAIGSTIGVVGGLIIGDAVIRAGITSPAMIVIIAVSTIATYTLVNSSLVTAVSLSRFFSIILTAFFGFFGFFISLFFIVLYLANMRTFGVPYLNVVADLSWSTVKKTMLRLPQKDYVERPHELNPKDKIRLKEDEK